MRTKNAFQSYAVAAVWLTAALIVSGQQAKRPERAPLPPPTQADVPYGKHKRHRLDFWRAKTNSPVPLVVFIHGGGWSVNDKDALRANALQAFSKAGISVASINYRYVSQAPFPASFHDAARAVQFLRSKADAWGIDPSRVAAYGNSAGGIMSLWLAFHDDRADLNSDDPVLRRSTRLTCAGGVGAASTLDLHLARKWVGESVTKHRSWPRMFGVQTIDEVLAPKMKKLRQEVSPIHHLTRDDPPVFLQYTQPNEKLAPDASPAKAVHHPVFGLKLQQAMAPLKIECGLQFPGQPEKTDPRALIEFIQAKLAKRK